MDEYEVVVAGVRDVGQDTIAIDVETPAGFDALPGQFVVVQAPVDGELVDRYYTISSPNTEGTFEMTVEIDPDGDVTPWLADLEAGDELSMKGPLGETCYDDEGDVLAVAGGPGVGPAVAIAERAVEHGHEVALVYEDDGFAHEDRLDALADAGAAVELLDETAEGRESALADAVATHVDLGDAFVFGFNEFCGTVRDALRDAGLDDDAIHVESFG
ncbi:ferredoxin--NADP reductase [Halorubellus salinus]|uniref:ferredoxin--NADP reductase n=1 Tax=Halorubellus salinus TaxID=755309 RepID=UPI001D089D08|nr:FAD-binding oxidoreductase [Halorubellus salinus]